MTLTDNRQGERRIILQNTHLRGWDNDHVVWLSSEQRRDRPQRYNVKERGDMLEVTHACLSPREIGFGRLRAMFGQASRYGTTC